MLPRAHRLRRSAEFTEVVRRGTRVATPSVVVHAVVRGDDEPVRVGFVAGRQVGPAVTRNRVKRRLRHLTAARLSDLPSHASLVVRANPSAATSSYVELEADLGSCLDGLARRRTPDPVRV